METTGERLKEFRKKRGVTMAHVIRTTGISRQRLYNFEAGKTRVPFSDLLKIVVMGLNSSLDEFVREEYNGESVKF